MGLASFYTLYKLKKPGYYSDENIKTIFLNIFVLLVFPCIFLLLLLQAIRSVDGEFVSWLMEVLFFSLLSSLSEWLLLVRLILIVPS